MGEVNEEKAFSGIKKAPSGGVILTEWRQRWSVCVIVKQF
jgi:hypothetical protein